MENGIDLSVIIPTYNSERFIENTLDSITKQTYKNIEWIFVDDASTDSTAEIIDLYISKKHIKGCLIKNIENFGAGKSRNIGVKISKTKYISFMDSDDILIPYKYEKMMELAKRGGANMVISGLVYLQQDNQKSRELFHFTDPGIMYMMEKKGTFEPEEFPELLNSCYLWNRIYDREWYLEKNIKIPEGRKFAEDLLPCVMSTVLAKKISFITEPLSVYVQHRGSLTDGMNKSENKLDFIKAINETKQFLLSTGNYEWTKIEFLKFICSIGFGLGMQMKFKEKEIFYKEINKTLSKEDKRILTELNFNNIYPETKKYIFK